MLKKTRQGTNRPKFLGALGGTPIHVPVDDLVAMLVKKWECCGFKFHLRQVIFFEKSTVDELCCLALLFFGVVTV